jgi:hypothetical protein
MMRLGALAAAAVALSVAAAGAAGPRQPGELRGAPLGGPTGLRLLFPGDRPFVADVDTGRVTRVRGVPPLDSGVPNVLGVGGRGAVLAAGLAWRHDDFYGVRGPGARVVSLGTGAAVVPASDGRSVWIKSFVGSRCTLRQVALDGRVLRAPRPFPCPTTLYPGGSLGIVVNRRRVLDPATGRTVVRTPFGVLAAAGHSLVLAGPEKELTLFDAGTRASRRLGWPSIVGGLDAPAVDPNGRLVALAFADPAWQGGGNQALDVWLLDTATGELTQLPGMPVILSLKATSMAWTPDGRLVLLGEDRRRAFVAVWRPGEPRLAVKTVRLPQRDGGSDAFALLA